jgi:hypothetical protein
MVGERWVAIKRCAPDRAGALNGDYPKNGLYSGLTGSQMSTSHFFSGCVSGSLRYIS